MNSPHWLDATLWLPLVQALLHTLWQGALLAGGLWLILRWIPARRATLRYSVCLGALAAVLVLGFGAWAMLDTSVKADAPMPTRIETPVEISPAVASQNAPTILPTSTAVSQETPPALAENPAQRSWAKWAAAFWLLGVVVCLIRTLRSVVGAGRLRRRCRELTDPPILALVEELRTRLRLSRPVRMLISAEIHVPAVLGVVWPTILLPAAMLSGLPVDQLRAILAHELAHIRRWDYLVNLGQMLIEALLFFNPFVWWISRQVRLEREACCDQIAAAECPSAVRYVEALVAVIERHRSADAGSIPQPMLAASGPENGSGKSQTLDRARRLLVPEYLPQLRLHWFSLGLVLALSGLALGGLWTSARAVAQTIQPPEKTEIKEPAVPPADDSFLCKAQVSTEDGTPLGDNTTVVRVFTPKRPAITGESSNQVESDGSVPMWISSSATSATVVATREGYAPVYYGPFVPPLKEKLDGLKIQLRKGFAASIQTVDEAGQPIAEAQIIGYYPGPPMVELPTVQTDATGTATIEHLGAAALNVRVRAPGFQSDELTGIRLDPAKPYRWTLKKGTSLAGRVITSTGESIAGATIKLAGVIGRHNENHSDPRKAPLITTADANGQFALTTLRPDSRYYFFVEAPGYGGVFLRNIKLDQGQLEVTLGPELFVRGKIIHASPSILTLGKLYLTFGQTLRIGNDYKVIGRQLEDLEPKNGEADFHVGPFYAEQGDPERDPETWNVKPAYLSVWGRRVNFTLVELPKTDFIFDLAAEKPASNETPTPSPEEKNPAPKQSTIEIESKFIEVPDAVADALQLPERPSFMDKFPGKPLPMPPSALMGVLDEKEAEQFLTNLIAQKGVDLYSSPRVETKSGNRAVLEIIREFRHPSEWNPSDQKEKRWTPKTFTTTNVGVTLNITPTLKDNGEIDLRAEPKVTEFLGFVDMETGEPVYAVNADLTKTPMDRTLGSTEDWPVSYRPKKAVFSTRKTSVELTIKPGQTFVFNGLNESEKIAPFQPVRPGYKTLVLIRASLLTPKTADETAMQIRDELRIVDGARRQAEEELKLAPGTVIPPATLKTFFLKKSRLYQTFSEPTGPVDLMGNPYGPVIAQKPVSVSTATLESLKDAVPANFWKPFGPK